MKIEEMIQKIWRFLSSDIVPVLLEHPVGVLISLLVLLIFPYLLGFISV